ncbi:MAG: hypothetical protein V1772_04805, partial [Chloroflexota bacterium]
MSERIERVTCAIPGCVAPARGEHAYCAAHLNGLHAGARGALLGVLSQAMRAASQRADLGDLAVIDEELRTLYAVRSLYLAWLREGLEGGAPVEPPSRTLRAWCESAERVIRLLRARRALGGGQEASFEALMEGVLDKVDEMLAAAA